jgi:hypothetical protein
MKQGPFALAGLCCPGRHRYYGPLGLPLGCRPLHGAAAYRPALLPSPAGTGPRRVSPVPRTTFWPFHAPYAERFLRTRSRLPGAFHGLRPVRAGSAPPWPPQAVNIDDAADFASCCGPARRSTPLRTPPLGDARGLSFQGPWHLPGPDLHRLAALSLSIGFALTISAPDLLGAHEHMFDGTAVVGRKIVSRSLSLPDSRKLRTAQGGSAGPAWFSDRRAAIAFGR